MRLIDADALSDALGEMWRIPKNWDGHMDETCEDAFDAIENAPTVDTELVRHGKWVWHESDYEYECSACGCRFDYNHTFELFDHGFEYASYCPNCGAKMDGDENAGD